VTVNVDCACGASLAMEDVSDVLATSLLERWYAAHQGHRRKKREYLAYLQAVHGPHPVALDD
jgi:hypothetical protein